MLSSHPLAGAVGLVLVAALLGGFAFLGFTTTDLANYNTSAAEARALDQKTTDESLKSGITLDAYRRSMELQVQVEKNKAEMEQKLQQEKNALELEQIKANHQRELEKQRLLDQVQVEAQRALEAAAILTGSLATLMLCAGLVVILIQFARSRFSAVPNADGWHNDPAWRRRKIDQARKTEQANRVADQAQAPVIGDENYTKLQPGKRNPVRQ